MRPAALWDPPTLPPSSAEYASHRGHMAILGKLLPPPVKGCAIVSSAPPPFLPVSQCQQAEEDRATAAMESVGRQKAPPGPKSCIQCRRSKQRCDIPDLDAVRPSSLPLPPHLACHRCKIFKLPCTIDGPLTAGTHRSNRQRRTSASPAASSSSGSQRYSTDTRSPPPPLPPPPTLPVDAAHQDQADLHIFDPHFEHHEPGKKDALRANGFGFVLQQQHGRRGDLLDTLQWFHPFSYLLRLCSAQPDFLGPSVGSAPPTPSLRQVFDRHAPYLDWRQLDMHLREYHLFLPFLVPLDGREQARGRAGLLFATSLYLAALKTDAIDLQVDLLHALRHQAKTCIFEGARDEGEVGALVALALYEPLLLMRAGEEMQPDGASMLAAASSAATVLHLANTPLLMRTFEVHSGEAPTGLLRQCSLWVTIALYTGFNNLAGSAYRRPGFECSSDDLDEVDLFCKRSREMPGAAQWAEQVSLLLLTVFRYRTMREFTEIVYRQVSILEGLPLMPYDRAAACIGEGVSRSHAYCHEVLDRLRALRLCLSLPEQTCNIFLDYLEYETMQFHVLCIINLTEATILRIAAVYGQPMKLGALVKRMVLDQQALQFASSVGLPRLEVAGKLALTFSNFATRWFKNRGLLVRGKCSRNDGITSLRLPVSYCCATLLLNTKCLADIVGGLFQRGILPQNCLADEDIAMASMYCRQQAEALRCFGSLQTEQMFVAKGHRDMFLFTAAIALHTSNEIHEWAAIAKGLRAESQVSHRATTTHEASSTASAADPARPLGTLSTQLPMAADGQEFQGLFEDILSTPIFYI